LRVPRPQGRVRPEERGDSRGVLRHPGREQALRREVAFNFPLICDTDRTIGTAYGANADPQKGAQRVGVVIDRDGKIKEWHARVDARAWPAEVVKTL
jgi:peroxiredoxin Q/BCP